MSALKRANQTSLITILSSEHGRLRREQRDIEKRDLQKALKYGKRETAWNNRWKITHDGVIFITDSNQIREITAFPAPLSFVEVSAKDKEDHAKAKLIIERKPHLCRSHTVIVVDNSGSMTTHDILLHRDRQVAAYTTTALEFVAEQLFQESANNTDVVSLIEFNSRAEVVFKREPVSWHLFNMLLARRDIKRTYVERERYRIQDTIGCDSNYMPALDAADKLLALGNHGMCALTIFFLSDGAPTDARKLGLTTAGATRHLSKRVADIATKYQDKINIGMVGFGNASHDFTTLEAMARAANDAAGSQVAQFMYCDKMANAVGEAITSLVTSTTLTKTELFCHGGSSSGKAKRAIEAERHKEDWEWQYFPILNHFVYDPRTSGWQYYPGLPFGSLRESNRHEARRRQASPPQCLAINKRCCGEGAERYAFRCFLADGHVPSHFKLGAMAAKETILVERVEENVAFHKTFCETQSLAEHLAREFNKRLCALPGYDQKKTPVVSFLQCSVLVLDDPSWPGGERGVLVEAFLDTERHTWCKWNNNAGAVDGKLLNAPLNVDREIANLVKDDLFEIAEGDSEDEEEGSDYSEAEDEFCYDGGLQMAIDQAEEVPPSEYLQAFSHFTYLFTNKKLLVCDLQGIYNTDTVPPTFQLSDPAIHYKSSKKREMVFGRTDKGKVGIDMFFKSHTCSRFCKFLQLSRTNKNWQKTWHRDCETDFESMFSTQVAADEKGGGNPLIHFFEGLFSKPTKPEG